MPQNRRPRVALNVVDGTQGTYLDLGTNWATC